jgi:hypothetical protein
MSGRSQLRIPFMFTGRGAPESPELAEFRARHPGWITIPATFVPLATEHQTLPLGPHTDTTETLSPLAARFPQLNAAGFSVALEAFRNATALHGDAMAALRAIKEAPEQFVNEPVGRNGGPIANTLDEGAHCDAAGAQPLKLSDGSLPLTPEGKPILVPPGISLSDNAAVGISLASLPPWTAASDMLRLFRRGGLMDYQRTFGKPDRINRAYIDFGNYNYGVVAAAAGYSLLEAESFAGVANLGEAVRRILC